AIAESCDIYFWKCVTDAGLTADDIADYAHRFGFGELTGCGLPTEQEGLVPTPEWKRESDRGRWYQGDTANLVIGQGDLKATPLQVAMATAAVANRGVLPRARIVRKIVWPRESGIGVAQWPKEPPRHIDVKPETLEAVRRGMRATVTFRNGTARGPMGGLPVTVAAKTGSAEVRKDQTPHSWFVWFAPYEQPRYACAVIVEYGGYGSEVAGWVARKILLAAFSHLSPASVASRRSPNAG
ncbi:MAG: penicillin-binding transpeptidase domain-containing protein, partial [Candidatus Zipacnadales bacterium]